MDMERTRYFRSANQFNVATNFWSGNILPLSDQETYLSHLQLLWVIFVWFIRITYMSTVVTGSLYFADLTVEDAFKKSGAAGAVCFELLIPTIYLNLRRKDLRNLISMYNVILIDSKILRRCVDDTVETYRKGLKFYVIVCFITASAWSAAPFFIVFDNEKFTYGDFAAPAYLPGEPFNVTVFVAGVVFQMIGACSISFGKISIDVYMSYFVAMLSAQYKFVRVQMSDILGQNNDRENDSSIINALQNCVRHHNAVIKYSNFIEQLFMNITFLFTGYRTTAGGDQFLNDECTRGTHYWHTIGRIRYFFRTGQRLTEILALYIATTYFNCILKFCFLAFGVITFESANIEKAAYFVYALACIVQAYLLCSCCQELLDLSTSVTDDAFHENWHGRSIAVKKFFCTMEVSNQMECRLTAYGVVDLIVPTLVTILSKSYSVCLLLLEVN